MALLRKTSGAGFSEPSKIFAYLVFLVIAESFVAASYVLVNRLWNSDWQTYRLDDVYVYTVTIDQSGRPWVPGENVLSVFDGQNWSSVGIPELSFPANQIRDMVFSSNGHLWMAIHGFRNGMSFSPNKEIGGIAMFDGTDWISFSKTNSNYEFDWADMLTYDPKGNLWVGSDNRGRVGYSDFSSGGISVFDGQRWTTYKPENSGLPKAVNNEDYVQALAFDNDGRAWIGTSAGLVIFDGQTWERVPNLWLSISGIVFDSNGDAAIGGDTGLWIFVGPDWQRISNEPVTALAVDSDDRLLLGDPDGFAVYQDGSWTRIDSSNSSIQFPFKDPVTAITVSDDHHLWISWGGNVSTPTSYPPQPHPLALRLLHGFLFHPLAVWFPFYVVAVLWLDVIRKTSPNLTLGLAPGMLLVAFTGGLVRFPLGEATANPWLMVLMLGSLGTITGRVLSKGRKHVVRGFVIGGFLTGFLIALVLLFLETYR